MRRSADFEQAVRRGVRAGRTTLVLHVTTADRPGPAPAVGFVVSKAVGNAVARNRVRRRLRAIAADRLGTFGPVTGVVVRALPPAAEATSEQLAADLDGALATVQRRLRRAPADRP